MCLSFWQKIKNSAVFLSAKSFFLFDVPNFVYTVKQTVQKLNNWIIDTVFQNGKRSKEIPTVLSSGLSCKLQKIGKNNHTVHC